MDSVIQFIYNYGIIAMFFIILLEYACFPVSSEIVLPFSGAFAASKGLPFPLVLIISVAAGILGTLICYAIGRSGGAILLERIQNRFPKTKKGIEASYDKFDHFGSYAVCFGRMIPLCRTYIAFIAGAAKQPLPIFISYSVVGIAIWNTILVGLGYLLCDNWAKAVSYYTRYKNILIPVILLLILFLVANKLKKRKL
ncbi:MAG: DedA family protein [Lachnospiraceae bacterium]|nr:DedA family protein [Lachnospiraceae bacterium]